MLATDIATALTAVALALTVPVPAGAVAAAKPARHFLTTQEFPGPPGYYEWGGTKAKKLKPVGCWEPELKGTPTSYRLYESSAFAGERADPVAGGGEPSAAKPEDAAAAVGVQYISVTKNAAEAERLVTAIKDRLKVCATNDVGTPKHPKKSKYLSFGDQSDGDELLIRAIHHSFAKTKKKPARAAVDAFGIGRDGRLVTVVTLTSTREDWGRSGWSPAKVVESFVPTAKAGVAKLR